MLNQYAIRTYFNESFGIDSADSVTPDALNRAVTDLPTNRDIAIYSLRTGECVRHVATYAEAWAITAANSGLYFYE